MLIYPQVRRFFCGNPACAKTTFAEQVPGLSTRYKRRTCSLQAVLQAVALALGGRPGARLTRRLSCTVSRSTLVRLIRAATDPDDAIWGDGATTAQLPVDVKKTNEIPVFRDLLQKIPDLSGPHDQDAAVHRADPPPFPARRAGVPRRALRLGHGRGTARRGCVLGITSLPAGQAGAAELLAYFRGTE